MICGFNNQIGAFSGSSLLQSQCYGYLSSQHSLQDTGQNRVLCDRTAFCHQQKGPQNIYGSKESYNSNVWNETYGYQGLNESRKEQRIEQTNNDTYPNFRVEISRNNDIGCSDGLSDSSEMSPENHGYCQDFEQRKYHRKLFFESSDVSSLNHNYMYRHIDTVGNFSTIGLEKCHLSPAGRRHLPEIQAHKYDELQPRSCSKPLSGEPVKKKKKRYRPFAAARERDRLVVMNSALRKLKSTLPLNDSEEKLSKKDILQTAVLYIKFLTAILNSSGSCNSEKDQKTLDLSEHNYLYS